VILNFQSGLRSPPADRPANILVQALAAVRGELLAVIQSCSFAGESGELLSDKQAV